MSATTSTLKGFGYEVQCAMHRTRVVGRVVEMSDYHFGKCLDSRDATCADHWYVEIHYTEFEFPGDEHVRPNPPRPAG